MDPMTLAAVIGIILGSIIASKPSKPVEPKQDAPKIEQVQADNVHLLNK